MSIYKRTHCLRSPHIFKFIHAADIHLDSPLLGLEQYEGAPIDEIRRAPRNGMINLVDLAIEQSVQFVIIAGDLYDGDWEDYQTGLFFVKQAARLREANIPLFLISGNHDAESKITRSLTLPPNVTRFASDAPHTVRLDELNVAIHGQSFATVAVQEDLSVTYPEAVRGCLNIGILHTSADGREGHGNYAPCSVAGLKLKGYDFWALGHIHKREILCEEPFISFSGNVQGRHIRETGPKGCLLVSVNDDRTFKTQFHPLDVMRWEIGSVDIGAVEDEDEVLGRVRQQLETLHGQSAGRALAVRVQLNGQTKLHRELEANKEHWVNQIRGLGIDCGVGNLWIEKVKFYTSEPTSVRANKIDDGAIGELTNLFAEVKENLNLLAEIGFDFSAVTGKLPAELRSLANSGLSQEEWLQEVLNQSESLLLHRLLHAPGLPDSAESTSD